MYTVDRVKNKGMTNNSFLLYAVISVCYGVEVDSPERDIAANKEVYPKLSKLKAQTESQLRSRDLTY